MKWYLLLNLPKAKNFIKLILIKTIYFKKSEMIWSEIYSKYYENMIQIVMKIINNNPFIKIDNELISNNYMENKIKKSSKNKLYR